MLHVTPLTFVRRVTYDPLGLENGQQVQKAGDELCIGMVQEPMDQGVAGLALACGAVCLSAGVNTPPLGMPVL